MLLLAWALQVLILAAGIHLFLRFVRTTRGSRLIRGLLISVVVGVVGLWGLSSYLDLDELEHILHGATGLIVVTLAIVFQPELRRAIAQLGEHSFVGRLMSPSARDTVRTIVRAAQSMANRRVGAIIAFERRTSLDGLVEAGTELDGRVRARLLEAIFQPGSPLHDGAVLIRKDRIVQAGCFLPLPKESVLDPRLGTRHRAALGLTEDSDAVVLVVSEETGRISLAKEGEIRLDLATDQVEQELRLFIERRGKRPRRASRSDWKWDVAWLPASILIACGILYVAHQDIRTTKEFTVSVSGAGPGVSPAPAEDTIRVLLPSDEYRLVSPGPNDSFAVSVTGSRAQLAEIGNHVAGVYDIVDAEGAEGPLELADVRWEKTVLGLGIAWSDDQKRPLLKLDRYALKRVTLTSADLKIVDEDLDPRYEVREEGVLFEPTATVGLHGPRSELEAAELALEPIVLGREDLDERREPLQLSEDLVQRGFTLQEQVEVVIPIGPAERDAGTIDVEIALVCMDPDRTDELAAWSLPEHARTARFTIETTGLLPVNADPGSAALLEQMGTIRQFVAENLLVFVDVAELSPGGDARSVAVRHTWRAAPGDLELDAQGRGVLDVRLESEARILLDPATAPPRPQGPRNGSPR